MFGGHGLYQAGHFFGLLMGGPLYFQTDERTRHCYLQRGMGPFRYEKARRILSMTYFEVPPDVLESRDDLVTWANRALRVAAARPERSPKQSRLPSRRRH